MAYPPKPRQDPRAVQNNAKTTKSLDGLNYTPSKGYLPSENPKFDEPISLEQPGKS